MIDPQKLQKEIIHLRRSRSFQTNLFLLSSQISGLTEIEPQSIAMEENWIFLLEKADGFYRLYYYVSEPDALSNSAEYCSNAKLDLPIVVDVLNTPQTADAAAEYFEKAGFTPIETLVRMSAAPKQTAEYQDWEQVELAAPEDAVKVKQLLYETFSIYVSRLPVEEEILSMISDGRILVKRDQSVIVGLGIFKESSEKHILVDQVLVDGKCRGRGIGKQIVEAGAVRFGKEKTIFLWAVKAAVPFYEKLGFQKENRIDRILLYKGGNEHGKNLYDSEGTASGI